jgi:hypothetical protein
MYLADATGVRGYGSGAVRGAGGQPEHVGDAGNESRTAHRGSVLPALYITPVVPF